MLPTDAPAVVGRYAAVAVRLAAEFDWVAPVVIARVVRSAAVTLAVTTGIEPTLDAVHLEARERLVRASQALFDDIRSLPIDVTDATSDG